MADEKIMDILDEAEEAEQPTEGEKKFTQADVDRIVKKRLHEERARKDAEQTAGPATDQDTAGAVDEREAALQLRETRLDCREYLFDKHYPTELLDILDTSDKKKFVKNTDALVNAFDKYFRESVYYTQPRKRAQPMRDPEASLHAALMKVRDGDDSKHTPRNKYFIGDELSEY